MCPSTCPSTALPVLCLTANAHEHEPPRTKHPALPKTRGIRAQTEIRAGRNKKGDG